VRRRVLLISLRVRRRRHTSVRSCRDILNSIVFKDSDCERDGSFAAHFNGAAGAGDIGLVLGAEVESGLVLVVSGSSSRRAEVASVSDWVVVGDGAGHDEVV